VREVKEEGMESTVLVVDDSKAWRDLVCVALKGAGYDHLTANDGTEALDILGTCRVDVIVTDMWMEGMGGVDLIAAVKRASEHRHIPILAVTTDATPESHQALRDAGALMVIQKPFTLPQLVAAVGRALSVNVG
jgi:two-component system chemotaxis response regulator CheY